MEIRNPILDSQNIRIHLIDNRNAIKTLSTKFPHRLYQFIPMNFLTIAYMGKTISDFEILISRIHNSMWIDIMSETDDNDYAYNTLRSIIHGEPINPIHTIHLTVIADSKNKWYKTIKAFNVA